MKKVGEEMVGRVAVVAVHGIGKHLPGETQGAIADLLLSLPARGPYCGAREFAPFKAVNIQIPLQPVQIAPDQGVQTANALRSQQSKSAGARRKRNWWDLIWNVYQEESADFAVRAKEEGPDAAGRAGLDYTKRLLQRYRGGVDGNVYRTTRLEGEKLASASKARSGKEVDIYEVLWADLARPSSSVVTFFVSLFQLIMHVASLSRLAIDSGAAEGQGRMWVVYRRLQRYAVRLLQIFVPLLEVLLLIALASCLPEVWSVTKGKSWAPMVLGAAGTVGVGIWIILKAKRVVQEKPWLWAIKAFAPLIVGGGLPALAMYVWPLRTVGDGIRADMTCAVLFWLVPGSLLLGWILSNYKDHRDGALVTGLGLYGASLSLFIYFLVIAYRSPSQRLAVVLATLWTAKILVGLARVCWGAMVGCAIVASLLGSLLWRRMRRADKYGDGWGRARAAVRTSRLALALPALLFLLVTLLIWAGFLRVTHDLSPGKAPIFNGKVAEISVPAHFGQGSLAWLDPARWTRLMQDESLLPPGKLAVDDALTGNNPDQNDYAFHVLGWSMGNQLPITLALASLTAFLLIWWALPSVLTESQVRRGVDKAPRDTSDDVSVRMGTWMSRGLDTTAIVTLLLWSALFLVPPLYWVALSWFPHRVEVFGTITFAIVTNTVVGFALLAVLAKQGQTVLSTILDVDTYLRSSPIEATPRATIFERYISVLRYLRDFRDSQGHGYDSIVIVAHSLGALISGDLLLFLQSDYASSEWDPKHSTGPKFTTIPITLLTMGNPARQLLNRFFPYLYNWVRLVPDNGKRPLPPPLCPHPEPIPNDAMPDPTALGLARWVNAYRSGDYVGRSLWLDEWYHRPAYVGSVVPHVIASADGLREELCIGAGAHTRYMDDTAPDIAWKLDDLI